MSTLLLSGYFLFLLSKSLKSPFWCSVLTPTGRFDRVYMPKCTKLSPSDWLIRYLHYGAVEQVYLIKWPVNVSGIALWIWMSKYNVALYLKNICLILKCGFAGNGVIFRQNSNRSACLLFLHSVVFPPPFLVSLWSPAFVNISYSSSHDSPVSSLHLTQSDCYYIVRQANIVFLKHFSERSYCQSYLFVSWLPSTVSFYAQRGGQLRDDEIRSIVWFGVSFCSTPMIILSNRKGFSFILSLFMGTGILQKICPVEFHLHRKNIPQHPRGHIRLIF